MGNFVTCGPNTALVKSGCAGTKIYVGKTGFKFLFCEEIERLDLGLKTLEIRSENTETAMGVRVNCISVAQVKINAFKQQADGQIRDPDMASILKASQLYLGDTSENINETLRQTMEGHQRQILGTLTVEQLYKDKNSFADAVRENVIGDLRQLGHELCSYIMTEIDDLDDYLASLGRTETALVKREAAQGESQNQSQARRFQAQYTSEANAVEAEANQKAHVAKNSAHELEAESDRNLNLKQAQYRREVSQAEAEANNAYALEQAKQNQKVVLERTRQKQVQEIIQLEISNLRVKRQQKEREGSSAARLLEQENMAKAIKVTASANADKVRAHGQADADVTLLTGSADADVLRMKAEAFQEFGEAAIVQTIMQQLPDIMHSVTKNVNAENGIIFISTDDGEDSVASKAVRLLAEAPEVLEALTGVDLGEVLRKAAGQEGFENARRENEEQQDVEPENPDEIKQALRTEDEDQPEARGEQHQENEELFEWMRSLASVAQTSGEAASESGPSFLELARNERDQRRNSSEAKETKMKKRKKKKKNREKH